MDMKKILQSMDGIESGNAKTAGVKSTNSMQTILENFDRLNTVVTESPEDSVEEAKPDFLDLDKDGDKKEPMKKAAKDAKKEKTNEAMMDDEVAAIIAKHPGMKLEYGNPLFDDLYDYFVNNGEMPIGIAKARDGDPEEWIADQLDSMGLSSVLEADDDESDELSKKLFKREPGELDKISREKNRKMNQKRFMEPYKPKRSGEWSTYESKQVDEAIMVSAEGEEAESLLQILKLSGMSTPAPAPAPAMPEPDMAMEPDMEPEIDMQDEYANSPDEQEMDLDAAIADGDDLNRSKQSFPAAEPGDNPMAAFESRLQQIMREMDEQDK